MSANKDKGLYHIMAVLEKKLGMILYENLYHNCACVSSAGSLRLHNTPEIGVDFASFRSKCWHFTPEHIFHVIAVASF